jgi:hypothetical protein
MALDEQTPAQAAGIDPKSDGNKRMTSIRNASRKA